MYEMGITRWKKTCFLLVEAIENIFSLRKMLNSKLLLKYIVIEHMAMDYFILWNALNYWKKEICGVNWSQD